MATAGNPRTGSSNHTPQSMVDVNGTYQYGVFWALASASTETAYAYKRKIGATWARSGTTVTVTTTSHGLSAAGAIVIDHSSSPQAFANGATTIATVPGADTFTITGVNTGATSGTCDWLTKYDLSGISGNPLGLPVASTVDDHVALVCGVDSQGRVHIMGNSFATALRYVRSAATSGIADITSWSNATSSITKTATGADAHTYHTITRRSDGKLLWSLDQRERLTDGLGMDRLLFSLAAGAGTTWAAVVDDGEFMVSARVTTGEANRVYLIGMTCTADDRVHFCGIWRTGDDDADTQQQPFYFYTDDLTTFYNVSGTAIAMPVRWANRSTVAISSAPGFSPGFGQGVAVDSSGYPHVILRNGLTDGSGVLTNPATGLSYGPWVRCYWDGTAWQVASIPGAGSAYGPSLHRVRGDLYLVSCSSSRAYIRNSAGATSSVKVLMGGPVDSTSDSGVLFEPNPDPVLVKSGEVCLMVPDGDTPRVFSFGNHARRVAS